MMNSNGFEWDHNKKSSNLKKHGVDFLDAVKVFDDPNKKEEDRTQILGFSDKDLLVVIYTNRNQNKRIISARRASKSERIYYYQKP